MSKKIYLSPEVEIIKVAVEKGFAASGVSDYPGWSPESPL